MSVFLGLIVHDTLPRDRYQQALKEIEQIMLVHRQDLDIRSGETQLQFKFEGTTFWLPRNPLYLNTIYYRICGEGNLQLAIELIWDCLCVIKEQFPSKVELYQENLDEFCIQDWEAELLRRQLNGLSNRQQSGGVCTKDEIEDIFAVLTLSTQQNHQRGQEICLGLINSELVQPFHLVNLSQNYIDQLQKLATGGQFGVTRQVANNIMRKFVKVTTNRDQALAAPETVRGNQDDQLLAQIRSNPKYDQSHSSSSIIFQLKETTDINRVCFYLDYILAKNKGLIASIPSTLRSIIEKYFDGHYGLDSSELTKYCVFHSLIIEFQLQYEMQTALVPKLLAIIEEGMVNWLTILSQLTNRTIFSGFVGNMLKFYRIEAAPIRQHREKIYQIVCFKLGLNGNPCKSNQQRICENLDEIKCISKQLALFLEQLIQ